MDKEKALDKIKKCLALSKSANEHEAAQALKHAQALMQKYELDERDVALAEIRITAAGKTVPERPQDWQWYLMNMVAGVFGCKAAAWGVEVQFYGLGNRPDLAAYAFDVVYRQLAAARRLYLKEKCTARRPSHRVYLANQYCEGWIWGVKRNVADFAMNDQEITLLEDYRKNQLKVVEVGSREKHTPPALEAAGIMAAHHGLNDGKNVQLHNAMNGAEELKQIGEVLKKAR